MKLILASLLRAGSYRLTPASDRENLPRRRGFTLGPTTPVQLQVDTLKATAAP